MTTDAALRREEVPAAFDTGAAAYARLVGANPGYHAHLRLSARRMRLPGDGRGLRLLDAGCGTGASTAALRRLREAAFTGVHSETMTGWQRDVVHTFLASAPLDAAGVPPDAAGVPPDAAGVPPDAAGVPPDAAGVPPDAAGVPPDAAGVPPDAAGVPPDAASAPPVTGTG